MLLPLLFSSMAGLAVLSLHLREYFAGQKSCYQLLLQGQDRIAQKIIEIRRLNPEVRRLKLMRRKAELHLLAAIASGQPAAIAVARSEVVAIRSRQLLVRTQQLRILGQGALQLEKIRLQASQKLGLQSRLNAKYMTGMALREESLTDPLPEYVFTHNFSHQQHWELKWSKSMDQARDLAARLLPLENWAQKGRCGVTLIEKHGRLRLRLAAGRFSTKYFGALFYSV